LGILTSARACQKPRRTQHSATVHKQEDRSFIGHPRGLGCIAFTEAWERFSYYGMQALLVLYMVNRLLHPGHIEHIAGFGPFRHLIESFRGPLSVQALASTIFGLYTGLVYLRRSLAASLPTAFSVAPAQSRSVRSSCPPGISSWPSTSPFFSL